MPEELEQGKIEISADLTNCKVILMEMITALRKGPQSRERSVLITKLQEARMWAQEAQAQE